MRIAAADLAPKVPQCFVTPDILDRIFRVARDAHIQPGESRPKTRSAATD